jgi:hypothetical protein
VASLDDDPPFAGLKVLMVDADEIDRRGDDPEVVSAFAVFRLMRR